VSGLPFERFWRRFDPRASGAPADRLLFFSFLRLLFLVLVQRRLTGLQASSLSQMAALRVSETGSRVAQDASFRAEWVDRRARAAEESGWSLAAAARMALEGELGAGAGPGEPVADAHGHLWTPLEGGRWLYAQPRGRCRGAARSA
jgi:hypothetical protein